ncbi:MAG: hypothetical protein GXP46_09940 [Deferribacteres bacterium]|nr:hypothetical protein [Deferribacteres bacterium]
MFGKSLVIFVISIFLFSAFALTEADAFRVNKSSAAGIEVYDADGQYLGLSAFSLMENSYAIYVPSLSSYVGINISTGEGALVTLYFQSNDCTGTPYVRPHQAYWIGYNRVTGKYYTGAKTVPVKMQTNSWLQSDWCRSMDFLDYKVPAEEVSADSLPFTFPVALPLQFKIDGTLAKAGGAYCHTPLLSHNVA